MQTDLPHAPESERTIQRSLELTRVPVEAKFAEVFGLNSSAAVPIY